MVQRRYSNYFQITDSLFRCKDNKNVRLSQEISLLFSAICQKSWDCAKWQHYQVKNLDYPLILHPPLIISKLAGYYLLAIRFYPTPKTERHTRWGTTIPKVRKKVPTARTNVRRLRTITTNF
jgi:hypothetical protein